MRTVFEPDEVSDREVIPRTPTLAGSTSSLDDSLLQSPYSTRFRGASTSSPTKGSSYPCSRILEGDCRAWWEEKRSTDSNWRASLELRPDEQATGDIRTHEALEPSESTLSQSDGTASITPAPTPSRRRSVSEAKESPQPDAGGEEPVIGSDDESEPSCYSSFQRIADIPIPQLSIVHQTTDSEPLYGPSVLSSHQGGASRANSSILAHCDQASLAPPCSRMTQTQSGRSALREAGIAHGSPRALAPPLPIENVPNRAHNGNFLQRLVRRTFSRPSFVTSRTGSLSLLAPSNPSNEKQMFQRSWPTRSNTVPQFMQAETSSRSQEPSVPKRSRWAFIQRFVAKPSTAAKAAGANIMSRTRTQPSPDKVDRTRRHTVISGHSSSVSFFGDPLVRIDPFARSGGLGATISPTDAESSTPFWNELACVDGHNAHTSDLAVEERWNQSQGVGDDVESNISGLFPRGTSLHPASSRARANCASTFTELANLTSTGWSSSSHPTVRRIGRRHSAPLLSELS